MIKCLQVLIDNGYAPIIAHVERYEFSSVPFVDVVRRMGCLVQMNYYSLSEEIDPDIHNLAMEIAKLRMVDVMGSDAHGEGWRCPRIAAGARNLLLLTDENYAREVLGCEKLYK